MTVQLEKSAGSVTEALKEIPEETKTIGEEALENLLEELINQAKIEEFTKKAVEQVSAAVKTEIERDAFLQTVLENTTAKVASVSEMESRMNQISVSTIHAWQKRMIRIVRSHKSVICKLTFRIWRSDSRSFLTLTMQLMRYSQESVM